MRTPNHRHTHTYIYAQYITIHDTCCETHFENHVHVCMQLKHVTANTHICGR